MAVSEWLVMTHAKSETLQAVVTSPIYCHKQEDPPAPLRVPEQKPFPEPAIEVAEGPVMLQAETKTAQLIVIAQFSISSMKCTCTFGNTRA